YREKGYKVAVINGDVRGDAVDEQGELILVNGEPIHAQAYQRLLFQDQPDIDLMVLGESAGVGLRLDKAWWMVFAQLPHNYVSYFQSSERALGMNPLKAQNE